VYELNITLFDALNDPARPDEALDVRRFLASQAIMLSLAGVPGIYVHSLLGSRNCGECVETSGRARSINREKFDLPTLEGSFQELWGQRTQVLVGMIRLLKLRRTLPAFHPGAGQRVLRLDARVFAVWRGTRGTRGAVLCLCNVSAAPVRVELVRAWFGRATGEVWELISGREISFSEGQKGQIILEPFEVQWYSAGAFLYPNPTDEASDEVGIRV
jgi:sucrose phosphorylase